jgi:hypothetical protein
VFSSEEFCFFGIGIDAGCVEHSSRVAFRVVNFYFIILHFFSADGHALASEVNKLGKKSFCFRTLKTFSFLV